MRRASLLLIVLSVLSIAAGTSRFASVRLDVPVILRAPSRNGPTCVEMVLAYHGADSLVWSRVERAFTKQPVSTEALAATARSLGYDARVTTPGMDSLTTFLRRGIPPIIALDSNFGGRPITRYMVITRFDSLGARFFVQAGSRPGRMPWHVLNAQWGMQNGRALVVTRR